MPFISSAIRERYLSIFREKRIEPQHIGFAVPGFVDDDIINRPCTLCAAEHIDEAYKVDFAIPLPQRDGDTRIETIGPASANCIAQALRVLAESESSPNYFPDLHDVLQVFGAIYSNNYPEDQSVQQKRRRSIDATFLVPPYLSVQEYFEDATRERWARFGDIRIARTLGLVDDLAKFWARVASGPTRHWPDPNNLYVMSVYVPMNLTELRYTNVRQATLCSLCGEFFAEIYTMHNGPGAESVPLLEADNYICEFCGASCSIMEYEPHTITAGTSNESQQVVGATTGAHGQTTEIEELSVPGLEAALRAMGDILANDTERAALRQRFLDEDEVSNTLITLGRDPRLMNIPEEDRTLIIRSLMREPQSQLINSIATNGLERGRITVRQRGVLERRLEGRAMDSEAPRCPVHHVPMMLVEGQFGQFYSCQDFPHCRIACNLQGQFRGVPDGTEIPQALPEEQARHHIERLARANDVNAPNSTIERMPLPAGVSARDMETLGSIARGRSGIPTPSNSETDSETEKAREQGRKFRKILIATIKQKCRID